MIYGVRNGYLSHHLQQSLIDVVTREDVNTLKNDWLTDNVSQVL